MQRFSAFTCSAPALLAVLLVSGCGRGDYCADVMANASIVDVAYDQGDGRVYVSLYHSLSYCTGTDEKRYAMELLEIDPIGLGFTTMHRTANDVELFEIPDGAALLFRDGNFYNDQQCAGCELVLRPRDSIHTLRFVTQDEASGDAMTLTVEAMDEAIMSIRIGGYESTLSETPAN